MIGAVLAARGPMRRARVLVVDPGAVLPGTTGKIGCLTASGLRCGWSSDNNHQQKETDHKEPCRSEGIFTTDIAHPLRSHRGNLQKDILGPSSATLVIVLRHAVRQSAQHGYERGRASLCLDVGTACAPTVDRQTTRSGLALADAAHAGNDRSHLDEAKPAIEDWWDQDTDAVGS
jgi:hypothetical protein